MSTPVRALGLAFSFVVMFVLGAGAAWADEPVGAAWPDGPERSPLDMLILVGGGTGGLIVLIVLFGLLTARRNYVPPPPSTELEKIGDSTPAPHH